MEFDLNQKATPERLAEFAEKLMVLQDHIGFKVSARGWCYQLESERLINKDEFDKVEAWIRGIMGYLFRLDDLRVYRPVSERSHGQGTFLNFREAASLLNVKSVVVRALVHHGVFTVAPGHKNGFAKLIAESEIRAFVARFRAAPRGDNRAATVETTEQKQAQSGVLRVPIPEPGRGFATFVPIETQSRAQTYIRCDTMQASGQRNRI